MGTIQTMKQPMMVSSHDVKLDAEYAEWIAEVKHRYRSAQVKAAIKVNAEKLLWNWQMGRDLVQKKAEERWGAGVVEQVSLDLQKEFPGEKGFSATNLWYMKKWYLYYTTDEATQKLEQVIREVYSSQNKKDIILHQLGGEIRERKLHQSGGEFPLPFALVPWKHHVEIITKCETIEKALFYIGKTIELGLSRDALINCINAKLYESQGKIVNNFSDHLPKLQSKLIQEVLKENYDFGFATVGHEVYDEDELEAALTENVTNLLIEMGNGFAFLGKLNFYVNAVDELKKAPDDNPTIGLLICSDMNKTEVQWSFKGISTPMGVASYNNIRIKDMLPTQEQLKERMELLKRELKQAKRLMNKK